MQIREGERQTETGRQTETEFELNVSYIHWEVCEGFEQKVTWRISQFSKPNIVLVIG